MISQAKFFGGAHAQAISSPHPYRLTPLFKRFYCMRAGAGGLHLTLEDPDALYPAARGGLAFTVENVGPANDFDLQDHNGNVLATLTPFDVAECWLGWTGDSANGDGAFVWSIRMRGVL